MAINFEKINKIKKYLPPKRNWNDIMKDDSIDIEKKILLNGLRYIFVSEMIIDIKKNIKKKIKIYPTGSKKISSDIDIQIALDLSLKINKEFFDNLIDIIIKNIKYADNIWGEFPNRLDVNFYPSCLFNFFSESSKDYNGLIVSKGNCCWVPILDNKDLAYEFLVCDIKRINKNYKHNLNEFYKLYKENISKAVYKLYSNYKKCYIEAKQHNELILELTKYNEIGPEMYYSVGSIIFVVWFLQLGNHLPKKLIKYLSIPSYLENKILFQKTKKQKYFERMNNSKKYMNTEMIKLLKLKI